MVKIDLFDVDNDHAANIFFERFDDLFNRDDFLALELFAAERADIERAHFVVRHRFDALLLELFGGVGENAREVAVVEHHDMTVFSHTHVDFGDPAHTPGEFEGGQAVLGRKVAGAAVRDDGDGTALFITDRPLRVGGKTRRGRRE